MIKLPAQKELPLLNLFLSHHLELIMSYGMRLQEGMQART